MPGITVGKSSVFKHADGADERRVNPVFGDEEVLRAAQCLNAVVGMRWYIALEKVMFYAEFS
jgi:hypothetical protein